MNAATVINLAFAAFLILAAVVLFRLCRTPRATKQQRAAEARKRVGLTVWDFAAEAWVELPVGAEPGAGQMTRRQIDEADQLELLWLAPSYSGPDLEIGHQRMRAALRDDQQGGETP